MKILTDSVYFPRNISGYGNKLEFSKNNSYNKNTFENETNSKWYLITMQDSGVFTFDIKTLNISNDWDFILYRYTDKFCEKIEAQKISPIRSNLSRSSETGLSLTSKLEFVGPGVNENYSKYVVVQKGEKFVLVVNNPKKSNQSHSLILHYPKPKKVVSDPIKPADFSTINFILSIKDNITKELVTADVNITGFSKKPIFLKAITRYESPILKKNHHAVINVSAKGYLLSSIEMDVSMNEKVVIQDIFLDPIESGKKVNLKNIQFIGDRAEFLPSSASDLKSLVSFMELNNSVTIEVEGHVNGPGKANSNDYQELSNDRAQAVKSYLVENGISENRIVFVGYGNSQMLYPHAKNSAEMTANRRVEIKIIAK
ncbi:MAG: hypothetical protein A3K10_17805 [Bacteroidetes bacterium RIFCSPLOWO2_12_FULL_31_6]|nr:MAG: hypothetical protein A3K10_17805 [Bacteroidetes bacterium RIFCSPLOWO2_12_FULL_31_6]